MPGRVVVTGMGALTPVGNNVNEFWSNILAGKSGAAMLTRFDTKQFRTKFGCELKQFSAADYLDKADLKRTDAFTQYALIAADEAIHDSGFDLSVMDPFDVGVIWGSGQGGMDTLEEQVTAFATGTGEPRFSPFFVPKLIPNMSSGMISIRHGYMGVNYTTVSACASSNTAIIDAFNYIRWGKAKIIITGGSEAPINAASIGGFSAMRALSEANDDPESASRPFAIDRNGFVMGEGAGALVLEDYDHAIKRGAKIFGEIAGASMTSDAYHITSPHPEGTGAAKAINLALGEAGVSLSEVDYINSHATSTPVGDISEVTALKAAKMDQPLNALMSSTKSITGHLLGAAGAIEAISCLLAIRDNIVPATINTTVIDPAIPEDFKIVLGHAKPHPVKVAMSNNFGFGGHNGIIVFREAS